MQETYHRDKTFDKVNSASKALSAIESCTFTNCDFSESNLSGNDFVDCRFEGCNLSMMRVDQTGLKNVEFHNCKLMGVDFSACNEFLLAVSFHNCILDFVSFFRRKLRKTTFSGCSIKEANFTQTDLTGAAFWSVASARPFFSRPFWRRLISVGPQLFHRPGIK